MSWFEKLMPSRISTEKRTRSVPEGVWIKCPDCDAQLYRTELERNLYVCPKCDHHMRIGARRRLDFFRAQFGTVGQGDAEPAWAREVLDSQDRTKGGTTAPAHGLTLTRVDYPERDDLP